MSVINQLHQIIWIGIPVIATRLLENNDTDSDKQWQQSDKCHVHPVRNWTGVSKRCQPQTASGGIAQVMRHPGGGKKQRVDWHSPRSTKEQNHIDGNKQWCVVKRRPGWQRQCSLDGDQHRQKKMLWGSNTKILFCLIAKYDQIQNTFQNTSRRW